MVLGTPGPTGAGGGLYFRFPPVHEFHGLKMLIPPTSEPLTVDDIRLHLRVDTIDEDALFSRYIRASREYCEAEAKILIRPQTWVLALQQWPRVNHIQIPIGPVQSISSVTYEDTSGQTVTMTEGADYFVDLFPRLARIVLPYGRPWPTVVLNTASPIRITFRGGYPYVSSAVTLADAVVTRTGGDVFDSLLAGFPVLLGADGEAAIVYSVDSADSLTLSAVPDDPDSIALVYDGMPGKIPQAMRMLCGHWYENREAVVIGRAATISTEVQLGVAELLGTEEIHRF